MQGTNFPPVMQEHGVKKNHAFSQLTEYKEYKNTTVFFRCRYIFREEFIIFFNTVSVEKNVIRPAKLLR